MQHLLFPYIIFCMYFLFYHFNLHFIFFKFHPTKQKKICQFLQHFYHFIFQTLQPCLVRSHKTSKCGKKVSDTLAQRLVCYIFWAYRIFTSSLISFLNRSTATWNLFVKQSGFQMIVSSSYAIAWVLVLVQFLVDSKT